MKEAYIYTPQNFKIEANTFLAFEVIKFVVNCYSSDRKLMKRITYSSNY